MTLYVIQVEAEPGVFVKVGDFVTKGQRIGLARDRQTPVVSPDDGVVKDVTINEYDRSITVNVISHDKKPAACAA